MNKKIVADIVLKPNEKQTKQIETFFARCKRITEWVSNECPADKILYSDIQRWAFDNNRHRFRPKEIHFGVSKVVRCRKEGLSVNPSFASFKTHDFSVNNEKKELKIKIDETWLEIPFDYVSTEKTYSLIESEKIDLGILELCDDRRIMFKIKMTIEVQAYKSEPPRPCNN